MKAASFFAQFALLPSGWANDVLFHCNEQGVVVSVQAGQGDAVPQHAVRVKGPLLPGMPNLHSHAFQRAFAGLSEYRNPNLSNDSFWTWRELMYQFAKAITPDQLTAIARALYVEMLQAGYTSVCEFHYLHHSQDGQPYADDATLSTCLIDAASQVGMGLTLLPVLYQNSGFGGLTPKAGQSRFLRNTDNMLALLGRLKPLCEKHGGRIGVAPHSLRAVTPQALANLVQGLSGLDVTAPIHIHIAEQLAEVQACVQWSGQRPVQWLLEHMPVDERWCLVHATHMTHEESASAARSGAVAGICPTTEANLGDGIFDAASWLSAGGAWGVGSDSHVCVNAAEELMQFEYSQRLATHKRNVLTTKQQHSVATAMMLSAVAGGAQASGRAVQGLAVGQKFDAVALDPTHSVLAELPTPQQMLAAHVFASHRQSAVDAVWVSGKQVVSSGHHAMASQSAQAFIAARRTLLEGK